MCDVANPYILFSPNNQFWVQFRRNINRLFLAILILYPPTVLLSHEKKRNIKDNFYAKFV